MKANYSLRVQMLPHDLHNFEDSIAGLWKGCQRMIASLKDRVEMVLKTWRHHYHLWCSLILAIVKVSISKVLMPFFYARHPDATKC